MEALDETVDSVGVLPALPTPPFCGMPSCEEDDDDAAGVENDDDAAAGAGRAAGETDGAETTDRGIGDESGELELPLSLPDNLERIY